MKVFEIQGVPFEFDEEKKYYDFFLEEGEQRLVQVDFEKILEALSSGLLTLEQTKEEFILVDRWRREATRKRLYRHMVKQGYTVLSDEYWFENFPDDEAEEIFVNLENSGHLAYRVLEAFFPEDAAKCNYIKHPAAKYYSDPEGT